jgi:4-amino-4-deoxy-L-arabinose transferase-like glycosyltransferase
LASTRLFFLLLVLYITLFFKLGNTAFLGADEPRYARVAEEMWQTGDYVVPTLHGKPWLEKPPLYYWLAALSYSILGVSEASARLPSALAAALCLLSLWWIARTFWNEETAFFAALITATSPLFFCYSRAASTDPLFSAFFSIGMLLCLYAFVRVDSLWPYIASGAAVGFALLAKGPVALVLAALSVVPVLAIFFSPKRLSGTLLGLLTSLLVAVPWYWHIIQRTGFDFISVFFLNHNLARFFTRIHHHEHPFYFYLEVLALGIYPWTATALLAALGRRTERLARSQRSTFRIPDSSPRPSTWDPRHHFDLRPATWDLRLVFLANWIAMPLIFFSASSAKLPAYILPLAPPLSLVISHTLSRVDEGSFRQRRGIIFGALFLCSLLVTAGTALASRKLYHAPWMGIGLGLLLAAGSLLAYVLAGHGLPSALLALAGANVVLVVFLTVAVLPVAENFHSARYVIQHSLTRLPAGEDFYQYRYFHHTVDYYSGGRAVMESIDSLDELRQILQSHSPLWIVTDAIEVPTLQAQSDLQAQVVAAKGNVAVLKIGPRRGAR